MGQPLRVLIVEDNADDVALMVRVLRGGNYEPHWKQVQTAEEFSAALSGGAWDVVLSDYTLPQFSGLDALKLLRARSSVLPFIVVSGTVSEETAVETMRAGANDYLSKSDFRRLLPAVERELREVAERRERTRTKRELLELQERFEVIFRELTDVMLIADARDGEILHANPALDRMLGFNHLRIVGSTFAALWPVARQSEAARLLERLRRDGSVFLAEELRRVDGSMCPVDISGNLVPWGAGQAVVLTLRDVTERQRAEQRLAREKEQLAVTLRSIGEGVITTDTTGRVVLVNRIAEGLTGWRQTEAVGQPLGAVFNLVRAETGESLVPQGEHLASGSEIIELTKDVTLRARDEKERAVRVSAAPIRERSGTITGSVLVFRDITGEQKLEEERQKASKLESVGILAGGIAHDFNNVLMAILGNLSLAKVSVGRRAGGDLDSLVSTIEKAENACLYATDLTRQLLTFAKGGAPIKQTASLAEIVHEAVQFALHGSSLRAVFDMAEDLKPVEVDRNQFRQVLDNLVINAVQATTADCGQFLYVTAQNIVIGEDRPVAGLRTGEYVRVSIRDTGIGISPEVLSKIFDPYFTTKREGSGLGLATAYSIVRKHEGILLAESEQARGSTFHVYLPASRAPVVAPVREREPALEGKGRILLMDDEAMLLELVSGMLEHLGYEVTCAPDGREAIERYIAAREEHRPFAAVIVDLTVPGGMGGYETVQLLHEVDPELRAIVSSGYSNDPIMANYRVHGFRGFIAKPYQIADLAKVLHAVLHEDLANREVASPRVAEPAAA